MLGALTHTNLIVPILAASVGASSGQEKSRAEVPTPKIVIHGMARLDALASVSGSNVSIKHIHTQTLHSKAHKISSPVMHPSMHPSSVQVVAGHKPDKRCGLTKDAWGLRPGTALQLHMCSHIWLTP